MARQFCTLHRSSCGARSKNWAIGKLQQGLQLLQSAAPEARPVASWRSIVLGPQPWRRRSVEFETLLFELPRRVYVRLAAASSRPAGGPARPRETGRAVGPRHSARCPASLALAGSHCSTSVPMVDACGHGRARSSGRVIRRTAPTRRGHTCNQVEAKQGDAFSWPRPSPRMPSVFERLNHCSALRSMPSCARSEITICACGLSLSPSSGFCFSPLWMASV